MECKEFEKLAKEYFNHKMEKDIEKEFISHVNDCENCKSRFLSFHQDEKNRRVAHNNRVAKISLFYKYALFVLFFIIVLVSFKYMKVTKDKKIKKNNKKIELIKKK